MIDSKCMAILTAKNAKNANFFQIKLCVLGVLSGDTHITLDVRFM
jgi:hypothetical protein